MIAPTWLRSFARYRAEHAAAIRDKFQEIPCAGECGRVGVFYLPNPEFTVDAWVCGTCRGVKPETTLFGFPVVLDETLDDGAFGIYPEDPPEPEI